MVGSGFGRLKEVAMLAMARRERMRVVLGNCIVIVCQLNSCFSGGSVSKSKLWGQYEQLRQWKRLSPVAKNLHYIIKHEHA